MDSNLEKDKPVQYYVPTVQNFAIKFKNQTQTQVHPQHTIKMLELV